MRSNEKNSLQYFLISFITQQMTNPVAPPCKATHLVHGHACARRVCADGLEGGQRDLAARQRAQHAQRQLVPRVHQQPQVAQHQPVQPHVCGRTREEETGGLHETRVDMKGNNIKYVLFVSN